VPVCDTQVLQNANTVTIDEVLLANGSAGHIVNFIPVVCPLHCGVDVSEPQVDNAARPLHHLCSSPECTRTDGHAFVPQAEALQRLKQRDNELQSELSALRSNVSLMTTCSLSPRFVKPVTPTGACAS
jgi:hypothetical protein